MPSGNEDHIDKLPEELLYSIFLIVKDLSSPTILPEVTLSGVCKHWRRIALMFPALWSTFSTIIRERQEKVEIDIKTDRLSRYLKRSEPLPISLDLTLDRAALANCKDMVGLTLLHIMRWKIFRLHLANGSDAMNALWPMLVSSCFVCISPSLEELTLTFFPDYHPTLSLSSREAARRMSILRELYASSRLTRLHLAFTTARHTPPPFAQLTHLTLEGVFGGLDLPWLTWQEFLDLLQAPSLISLCIRGNPLLVKTQGEIRLVPSSGIVMPSMKRFRYQGHSEFCKMVLPHLYATQLEALILSLSPSDDDAELESIIEVSQPYFPNLQSLTLLTCRFSNILFYRWLSRVTSHVSCVNIINLSRALSTSHLDDRDFIDFNLSFDDEFGCLWGEVPVISLYIRYRPDADLEGFARTRNGHRGLCHFYIGTGDYEGEPLPDYPCYVAGTGYEMNVGVRLQDLYPDLFIFGTPDHFLDSSDGPQSLFVDGRYLYI